MGDKCMLCGRFLPARVTFTWLFSLRPFRRNYICQSCYQGLHRIDAKKACKICGRPFSPSVCEDCKSWKQMNRVELINHALYPYDELRDYMERYKFQGDYRLRLVFAEEMKTEIKQIARDKVIIPIPISEQTKKIRKFNQVEGWLDGTDYQSFLLANGQKIVPQSKKTKADRMKLVQPFVINPIFQKEVNGKACCLVDDVYTTGATLHLASELLLNGGAKSVSSITLAR